MSITVPCACGKVHQVPNEFAGKKIKCTCLQILVVPTITALHPKPARTTDVHVPPPLPSASGSHPKTSGLIKRTVLEPVPDESSAPPPVQRPLRATRVEMPTDLVEPAPSESRRERRPDRDFDDEPAPRKSKRSGRDYDDQPSRSKGRGGAMIGLVGGLLVLVALGGGGLIWWVISSEDSPQASADKTKPDKEKDKPKDKANPQQKPPEETPVAAAKLSPEQLYRQLLRSTTWILTEGGASGTGVLIDAEQRLILTNHHVIRGSRNPMVYFAAFNGNELIKSPSHYTDNARTIGIPARLVADDPGRDLALLHLPELPPGVPAVSLARESLSPGAKVHTIGNSGINDNAMWRYVSGSVRQIARQTIRYSPGHSVDASIMETDSATNPGDSGGPTVDDRGVLVAIVTGGNTTKRLLSMFIDIREIRAVVEGYYKDKLGKSWRDTTPSEVVDLNALPKWIQQLESPDTKVRAQAARALGNMGPDARAAVPGLLAAYKAGDPVVNQQILTALEKIGPPDPTEVTLLIATMKDTRPEARLYAIRSLTQIGTAGARGLPALKEACKDSEVEVRLAALKAFTRLSPSDSLDAHPLGIAGLADPEARIRRFSATMLAIFGKNARSQVLTPLMNALNDRDATVRADVEKALGAISPMTEDDVDVLKKAMNDPNPSVRYFAASSLQLLDKKALPAVAELVAGVEDKDTRVRLASISGVGKLGAPAVGAVPGLLRSLKDSDTKIRAASVAALGSLGRHPGVYSALFNALTDREVEVRATAAAALKQFGKPDKADVPEITKFLTAEQPLLRGQAAAALGRLGVEAKESVPALARMVREDKSIRARLAAISALTVIGPTAREASEALALALNDTIAPTEEDVSDLFEKPTPKGGTDGPSDPIHKALLRSTVIVGVPQRFGQPTFSSGWVVDTTNRLIATSSRNVTTGTGLLLVCFPDINQGEVQSQLRHYQQNSKRLAIPARIVYTDTQRQLVLLQLAVRMPALVLPIRLAETGVGAEQTIHLMGARSVDARASQGTLWNHTSARVRQISLKSYIAGSRFNRATARFIETETQLNCDDSGGPVVNDKLQLVGMVSGMRDLLTRLPQCMDLSEIKVFLGEYAKLGKIDLGNQATPGGSGGTPVVAINQTAFRCSLAAALEKIGTDAPDKVVPALRKALKDPAPEVQAAVLNTIASLGGKAKAALPDLLNLLKTPGMQAPIEEILVKMGADIVPSLNKILGASSKSQVLAAVRVLAKLGKEGKAATTQLLRTRVAWKRDKEVVTAINETLDALKLAD